MTNIIPAIELDRRRAERDQKRQERKDFAGSILGGLLDDEPEEPCAPASRRDRKETRP